MSNQPQPPAKPDSFSVALYTFMVNPALSWDQYLHVQFSAPLFPIHIRTLNLSKERIDTLMSELFTHWRNGELNKEWVDAYHSYLNDSGYLQIPSTTTSGVCQKGNLDNVCKAHPNKWSCNGCGKVFIPGSYDSKTCKKHDFPWWMQYMQEDVSIWIEESGGVSKKAALVHDGKTLSRPFLEAKKAK